MMSQHTLLTLFGLALAHAANAQSASSSALEPLASKTFTWPDIPYQVTGDQGGPRGPQAGFNLCNSTTENQDSMCQVSMHSYRGVAWWELTRLMAVDGFPQQHR